MACEQTALEAFADVLRLERELDVAVEALTETTNQLCDALTMIAFLRQLIPQWKSAPAAKLDALEAENRCLRETMARYTRSMMQ